MAKSGEMYDMRLKADTSTQDLLKSLMARNIELFDEERTRNRGQTYLISQDSLEQKTKANCLEPPEPRGRGRDKGNLVNSHTKLEASHVSALKGACANTHPQASHTPKRAEKESPFDDCMYPTSSNLFKKNRCGTQRHSELSILQYPDVFSGQEQTLFTSTPTARDRRHGMEQIIITGERLVASEVLSGERKHGWGNDLIDIDDWAAQSEASTARCELPAQLNREHMHQLRAPLPPPPPPFPTAVIRFEEPQTVPMGGNQVTTMSAPDPANALAPAPLATAATVPDTVAQLPQGMFPLIATGHTQN